MSILDRLAGDPQTPHSADGGPAAPDGDMAKVLEEYAALGPAPIEACTPEEARRQPLPADAVISMLKKRGADGPPSLGVQTQDITYAGAAGPLAARVYRPDDKKGRPLVAYFHGGGWVIAGIDAYDSSPRAIAKAAGAIVVSFSYRMAPEHRFPAAHDDAFAAYQWLLENGASLGGNPSKIAVMGESAGGNLAANVAIRARDEAVQAPCHMALIYPVAGADMNNESYRENADAKPLNKAMMQWFVGHVFDDPSQPEKDGRINLVETDLHGLPSATIITAEIDPLRTEGELLRDRLEASGGAVRGKTFNGVTHEFFGMGLVVRDAAVAEAYVAHDLKRAFHTAILPF